MRRNISVSHFISNIGLLTIFLFGVACQTGMELQTITPPQKTNILYINSQIPDVERPAYQGQRYAARVPDTLNLAERAALAVNGLTSPTDPDADFEIYWISVFAHQPPYMIHDWNDHVQIKFVEALPLMRMVSGSRLNENVEQCWMERLLRMQGPDGLLYYPLTGRPWARRTVAESQFGPLPDGDHYTEPYANGRLLGAIAIYYELTGDERWRIAGEKVVDGLMRQAVVNGDQAYFSSGMFGVGERSDPSVEADSIDPWMNMTFGWIAMGLAQFYNSTDYAPALDLSGKLARHIRYRGSLYEDDADFIGIAMHFHGHLYPLLGMLEYAVAASDEEMIDFVRRGFEVGLQHMNTVVGYVPEMIDPAHYQTSEICGVADMIALGLKLSRIGAGDYWDDVDRWIRNQFAEGQLTRTDWVEAMLEDEALMATEAPEIFRRSPFETTLDVPERCLGGFAGWPSVNDWQGRKMSFMQCCTGNGARAIYYAWENILSHEADRLKVNLLLNRASPWADVDSYIPYEGRVDVKIKQPFDLQVRIPQWVTPEQTKCKVNDQTRPLSWDGRYAVVGPVEAGQTATLTFPIAERTTSVEIEKKTYRLVLKGNDVVDIDPQGKYCPLYQRRKYRQPVVIWNKINRFVAERRIDF